MATDSGKLRCRLNYCLRPLAALQKVKSGNEWELVESTLARKVSTLQVILDGYVRRDQDCPKIRVYFRFDTGADISLLSSKVGKDVFGSIPLKPTATKTEPWVLLSSVFQSYPAAVRDAYLSFAEDNSAKEILVPFGILPPKKSGKSKEDYHRYLGKVAEGKRRNEPVNLLSLSHLMRFYEISFEPLHIVLTPHPS